MWWAVLVLSLIVDIVAMRCLKRLLIKRRGAVMASFPEDEKP